VRHLVDVSHTIEHGMVTYPGLPTPVIGDHISFDDSADHYAPGTEFHIARIEMVANTGTYLDTPAHRFRGADGLDALDLARVVDVPAVVVDSDATAIGAEVFRATDLSGRAVLVRTGWSRHWGTDRYLAGGHPFLTEEAVDVLASADPAFVGIDSLNIDDTSGGTRPAHTGLLGAGIPIVEHLTALDRVPAAVALRVTALPPAVRGMGTFPVRVVVTWEDEIGSGS
jgi:arylformamidase